MNNSTAIDLATKVQVVVILGIVLSCIPYAKFSKKYNL
jgi:hypothetical protein